MTPGDRAGIPLEAEPIGWMHPVLVGTSSPGGVQPVERDLALEEEPALWPELPAGRPAPDPARRSVPSGGPAADGAAPPLPATGRPYGWGVAAGVAALAWVLRRRTPDGGSADRP